MSNTIHATRGGLDVAVRPAEPTTGAGTTTGCAGSAASTANAAAAPAPDPARRLTRALRDLDETAWWHARRLRNLARRHGSRTEQQRRRLFDSVVRHVNAGDVGLDEANAFLQTLGIGPAAGPGEVSFRVPVAMAMIHEDVEGDIGTFQYDVEEHERYMRHTRLDGYPNGFRVARPSRADVDTGRRYTVVSTDLRLTVTVPAYTDDEHLIATATRLLADDLTHLPDEVDILDEPRPCNRPPTPRGGPADIDTDPDSPDGVWEYLADEFDEGNYINYGLDHYNIDDETVDEFGQTPPATPRNPFAYDGDDCDDDETGDWDDDR